VAVALELGAVVVTNLDDYSPVELVHMENVIDLSRSERLPDDPEVLGAIGKRAEETARARSWSRLIDRLGD
jgi:hypothetical protein